MDTSSPRNSRWPRVGCTLALLAVVYVAYRLFNPYDEVRITVTGLTPDTNFLCLVADTAQSPQLMEWSLFKVAPFTMHPDNCTVSYVDGPQFQAAVRWINSERVGVLWRTKERKWFLGWYNTPKSRLRGRSLLFGGGSWGAHLRDADEVEPLSEAQLRAMGIDYSLKPD